MKDYPTNGPTQSGKPNNQALEAIVSKIARANATNTKDTKVATLLDEIKNGRFRQEVDHIRAEYGFAKKEGRDAKKAVAELKEALPAVLWSGTFSYPSSKNIKAHSGILCADLDDIGESLEEVRIKLQSSPYSISVFKSPTWTGLKALFRVRPEISEHLASFLAVEKHVRELTGFAIDRQCKDLPRRCFLSYDPDLWIRPDEARELPGLTPLAIVTKPTGNPEKGGEEGGIRLNSESCISESLNSCIPASLHNNAVRVLENIKAKRAALESLAGSHPNLAKLYSEMIERRFEAQAHARNHFLVQAVPFLYRAVAPRYVLALVGCFYDSNRALFKDSREQHMREALAMLGDVTETYRLKLGEVERNIYDALLEREQDAFRICRDFALSEKPDRPRHTFFMSCDQLGNRLGLHPPQAHRIMRTMQSYGIIKLLEKGTLRAKGLRGKAGSYQWCLDC